ncbi:MAG: hypothetical protein LUD77_00075 [Clostridiales bacterium]|nr:hypothetical protein [Clostridiales bacterium]
MDYIEYEQTAEALKCIENYPPNRSDRETERLLNKFYINDRKAANAHSRNFYNYFNLCSEKRTGKSFKSTGFIE